MARPQRRPHERGTRLFETVVAGCTDSRGADQAFRRALELTRAAGGTLHIVCALGDSHDGPPPHLPSEFRHTAAGAGRTEWHMYQLRFRAESAQVRVETHAVLAPPADAITKIVADEGADLVVVGTGEVVSAIADQAALLGWETEATDSAERLGDLFDWAGATAALIVPI